jgi:hypothetical protein
MSVSQQSISSRVAMVFPLVVETRLPPGDAWEQGLRGGVTGCPSAVLRGVGPSP